MEPWKDDVMESWKHDHSGINFDVIFGDLEIRFGDILEVGRPDEAKWGLEGSRAILTDKTHAIVRVTPISLQSGEPRTLKHGKNTYKNARPFWTRHGATFHSPNSPPEPLQDKPVWGITN